MCKELRHLFGRIAAQQMHRTLYPPPDHLFAHPFTHTAIAENYPVDIRVTFKSLGSIQNYWKVLRSTNITGEHYAEPRRHGGWRHNDRAWLVYSFYPIGKVNDAIIGHAHGAHSRDKRA